MTLNDCTKSELLQIIDRLSFSSSVSFQVDRILTDLEYERNDRKYRRADEILSVSREKLKAYNDLIRPYEGRPLRDIPDEVLQEASELLKAHLSADAEWAKLMGIKIDKPKGVRK